MTDFRLDTEPRKLVIAGVDVTEHVRAVDMYAQEGEPAEVQVWVTKPGVITGEGIVVVHEPPDEETITQAVRTFLESLDVKTLQSAADALPSVWATKPAENVLKVILEAL